MHLNPWPSRRILGQTRTGRRQLSSVAISRRAPIEGNVPTVLLCSNARKYSHAASPVFLAAIQTCC